MSLYALVETGSKQYRVEPKGTVEVELLSQPENQKEIILDKVLWIQDGEKTLIGKPYVSGAKVICSLEQEFRTPKVVAFKFRRRKASRKKIGHRQNLLRLRVKDILFS